MAYFLMGHTGNFGTAVLRTSLDAKNARNPILVVILKLDESYGQLSKVK